MTSQQLTFDLEPRPALDRDDFLVAPCNADAIAWIDKFPDWPAPALVISGAAGSGKTHLARVFMAQTEAVDLAASALLNDATMAFPDAPAVVIEDAHSIAGDTTADEALFHLYNQAKERGAGLLLSATSPAARWPIALPDLTSRLRAAPSAEIGAPDDALLMAVLAKLFADRQIRIDADVLNYVMPRMERSFAAARNFAEQADRLSLSQKRRITVPLARRVLETEPAA